MGKNCSARTAQYPLANSIQNSSKPLRKFFEKILLRMREVAHNLYGTLINVVGTLVYDMRSKTDPLLLVRNPSHLNMRFGGDQYWPSPNFHYELCWSNWMWRWPQGRNSYEKFCLFGAHFYWYGADADLVCEHCACRDGKRLRRTRRLLRKSHGQRRASKLLRNDSGSSPIAIWHAGSRLSQQMRHSSH
jgi:hypothetical protein